MTAPTTKNAVPNVNQQAYRPMRRYEYMPASTDSGLKGLAVGIRYTRNAVTAIKQIKNGCVCKMPDRTIVMIRSYEPTPTRLKPQDFDEVMDMDWFLNKNLLGEYGYKFAMVNSHGVSFRYHTKDWDKEKEVQWPSIVADSGGFQLNSGAADWVDPTQTIQNHNAIADIGIALDIPLPHFYQKWFLARSAKIQVANNNHFLENKRKSLDIMNVFHGSTFYLREKFREKVEDERMTRCALGGVKTLALTPLVLHCLLVMTRGRKYDQYHVLGVSGIERWIAMAYLASKKVAKLVTSDSSAYIQSAIGMQYFTPDKLQSKVDYRELHVRKSAPHTYLSCSCPVCNLAKYPEALVSRNNRMGFALIETHNLIITRSYLDEIWALGHLPKQEIISYVRNRVSPAKASVINHALNAIDYALDNTLEKAAAKFAPYLLEKYIKQVPKGLFNAPSELDSEDRETALDEKRFKYFDKVLTKYERHFSIKPAKG